jgi:hypothetical protein
MTTLVAKAALPMTNGAHALNCVIKVAARMGVIKNFIVSL